MTWFYNCRNMTKISWAGDGPIYQVLDSHPIQQYTQVWQKAKSSVLFHGSLFASLDVYSSNLNTREIFQCERRLARTTAKVLERLRGSTVTPMAASMIDRRAQKRLGQISRRRESRRGFRCGIYIFGVVQSERGLAA